MTASFKAFIRAISTLQNITSTFRYLTVAKRVVEDYPRLYKLRDEARKAAIELVAVWKEEIQKLNGTVDGPAEVRLLNYYKLFSNIIVVDFPKFRKFWMKSPLGNLPCVKHFREIDEERVLLHPNFGRGVTEVEEVYCHIVKDIEILPVKYEKSDCKIRIKDMTDSEKQRYNITLLPNFRDDEEVYCHIVKK